MPRQMEFLYSLSRLYVAMSRARGLSVLVCSPAIMRIGDPFWEAVTTSYRLELANCWIGVCSLHCSSL
jgi:hypothetical protein